MFSPLNSFTTFIVYNFFALSSASKAGEILHFFIYNTLKIFLLILIIGFFIGVIRVLITPAKTKQILSGKNSVLGGILASFLAVITPVESFSVVPVFIGFLEAGIPTGIAFTYLITAPMTNEFAFILLLGLFGYKIAFSYYVAGIIIGLTGGAIIGMLKPEKYLKSFIFEDGIKISDHSEKQTFKNIIVEAKDHSFNFFKNFWPYIIVGVCFASVLHGYIPSDYIMRFVGVGNPYAIPLAVFFVIFFYVNIAMALPVIMIFVAHGLPIGTVLAFTMAVTATSIPELLILKSALKLPLMIIYFVLLLFLIIMAGYIINFTF
ncbi:MAG: permease [Candidatus Gastranaerophilales bacterium]|nr:permease [Candidatus Gastranaerophilales bacterium]